MRKELEGLQGNEYFAAWDRLMRDIGGQVIAYFKDLLLWAEDEQAEVGLYGATCDQFDLPVKTLVIWLGKQGIINRQLYDLVVSGYRVEQIRARGVHLLQEDNHQHNGAQRAAPPRKGNQNGKRNITNRNSSGLHHV